MLFIKRNWPLALYTALIFFGIFYHECWRDELQSLLIAHDQKTLLGLFTHSLKYEGHPGLWHLLLRFFTSSEIVPFQMQLLNAFIMLGAVSLFWFYFPLEGTLKTLLVFNYFFIFEYAIIARSYSLGIFLLFFYLSFFDSKKLSLKNLAFFAFCLVPQTSVYGLMICVFLMMFRILNYKEHGLKNIIIESGFFLSSCILAIGQMYQPQNSALKGQMMSSFKSEHLITTLASFGILILNIPSITSELKWEAVQSSIAHSVSLAGLGIVIMAVSFWYLFKNSKKAGLCFLLGTLSLVAFTYFIYFGSLRHKAHLILLFLAFVWLLLKKNKNLSAAIPSPLVFFLAAFSCINGVVYYVADLSKAFSDAKNVAYVIGDQKLPILVFSDEISSSLSGYLKGKKVLSLRGMKELTYTIWNSDRGLIPPTPVAFKEWLQSLQITEAIFVLNNAPPIQGIEKEYEMNNI